AVAEIVSRTDDFSNVVRNLLSRGDDGLPHQLSFGGAEIQALASSDPPVHTLHRKTVFPELVARRMSMLEADIENLTRALLDDFVAAGGGDFMHAVGNAVPISVIGRLIGFRDSDPDALLHAAFDSTLMVGATATLDELGQLVERSGDIGSWIT